MKKIIKRLPVIWLIVGLLGLTLVFFGYQNLIGSGNNTGALQHPIESEQTRQQIQTKQSANYDAAQIKPVTTTEYAKAQLDYRTLVNQSGIGALYIPTAAVQTKILAGMANDNLIVAVGTYRKNQQLGRDNYVVLAHNLVQGGGPLAQLNQAKVADIIYATDFVNVYEYRVSIHKIENQVNGELLQEPVQGESAKITLFRCEGALNTPNRMVVQGEFVKKYPAKQATTTIKKGLGLVSATQQTTQTKPQTAADKKQVSQPQSEVVEQFSQPQSIQKTVRDKTVQIFAIAHEFSYLLAIGYLIILVGLIKIKNKLNE